MFAETACLSRTRDDVGSLVNFGCLVRVDILQCPTSSVHLCNFRQFGQGILWLSFNRSEYKILFFKSNSNKPWFFSFVLQLVSIATIAYLCVCAYSTVLKIRVLNLYYLAPHHQTDEYSLIFSGMLLCRLTPPMCLNFLGLIHMDSHIIKARLMETYYTQVTSPLKGGHVC